MPLSCLAIWAFYDHKIREQLSSKALTIPGLIGRSGGGDGDDGATTRRISCKLRRAAAKAVACGQRSSLQFMVVYLLYPGCTKQIFSIFECRRIGDR